MDPAVVIVNECVGEQRVQLRKQGRIQGARAPLFLAK